MDISINGLSDRQKRMLDIMWNLPTLDDLRRWRNNLSKEEYRMSISLEELLKAEFVDQLIQTESDTIFAQTELNRIWNKTF